METGLFPPNPLPKKRRTNSCCINSISCLSEARRNLSPKPRWLRGDSFFVYCGIRLENSMALWVCRFVAALAFAARRIFFVGGHLTGPLPEREAISINEKILTGRPSGFTEGLNTIRTTAHPPLRPAISIKTASLPGCEASISGKLDRRWIQVGTGRLTYVI